MSKEISTLSDKQISRRAFAGGLVAAAAAGLAACAPSSSATEKAASAGAANSAEAASSEAPAAAAGTLTPGTYTATKPGFMGENTVFVTVDDSSIVDVAVGNSTDVPPYITRLAITDLPASIVENQSTAVDVISGATFTSQSVISAVKDCLEQAGAGDAFDAAPQKAAATAKNVEADVLVIGGGMSGCMAALSAKQANFDGVDSGLNVVLIEKQAFVGGSTPLAYGGFFTTTPLSQKPLQSYIDSEIDRFERLSFHDVNKPLITNLLNTAGDTVLKMQDIGVALLTAGMEEGEQPTEIVYGFNTDPSTAYPFDRMNWKTMWGDGYHIFESFNVWFKSLGMDVRLNTSAAELIMDGGKVVGAKVEGPEGAYEIRAKKVILSSGGFAQNKDMIAQYAPHDADSLVWSNGGADGDGIRMGVEAGGHTVGDRLWGHVCTTNIFGFHNAPDDIIAANGFLVNKNGETFVANGNDNSMAYALIAEQPDKCAYTIVDSASGFGEMLDEGLESGKYASYVTKADTIEELAELCEIDAAKLQNTIDEYNNHLATRGEVDWAAYDLVEDPEFIGATPIEQGPFYAVKFVQVHLGSCVGLVVDENCKVLDEGGSPIENLFATGECCIGGNVFDMHVGGWGIGGACYSGRIAGETAKSEIGA